MMGLMIKIYPSFNLIVYILIKRNAIGNACIALYSSHMVILKQNYFDTVAYGLLERKLVIGVERKTTKQYVFIHRLSPIKLLFSRI